MRVRLNLTVRPETIPHENMRRKMTMPTHSNTWPGCTYSTCVHMSLWS
uniref:Uncharacterized protein n=1 Tax=Anguilla anguilla TaxID=7936 RepID=A0A0E9W0D5_ANGAN